MFTLLLISFTEKKFILHKPNLFCLRDINTYKFTGPYMVYLNFKQYDFLLSIKSPFNTKQQKLNYGERIQ